MKMLYYKSLLIKILIIIINSINFKSLFNKKLYMRSIFNQYININGIQRKIHFTFLEYSHTYLKKVIIKKYLKIIIFFFVISYNEEINIFKKIIL